jgi:hypothetical protein
MLRHPDESPPGDAWEPAVDQARSGRFRVPGIRPRTQLESCAPLNFEYGYGYRR